MHSQTGLTSTETTLMKHAKDAVKELIGETNAFFNDQWKSYRSRYENASNQSI